MCQLNVALPRYQDALRLQMITYFSELYVFYDTGWIKQTRRLIILTRPLERDTWASLPITLPAFLAFALPWLIVRLDTLRVYIT